MKALHTDSNVLTVTPPGSSESVYLRWPSFAEWHDLARAHRSLKGDDPSAELIAKTITTCVSDETGKPLKQAAAEVMKGSPRRVMWLYRTCWETVLKSDDEVVGDIEKN